MESASSAPELRLRRADQPPAARPEKITARNPPLTVHVTSPVRLATPSSGNTCQLIWQPAAACGRLT